jgi:membrane protease YdiL (CAAX protease family)
MVFMVMSRERRSAVIETAARTTSVAHGYGLTRLILLHLAPGVIFTAFVIVAAWALSFTSIDPAFALFGGIGLVLVPLELGYLSWYARRTTGSWSPLQAVDYTTRVPGRRLALLAGGLAAWFFVCLAASVAFLDTWLSENVFSWMPHSLLQFASVDSDRGSAGRWELIAFLLIAFVCNAIIGPITEELYFRGHLLPRLQRFGSSAPAINTVLFAMYHFFSPWRYPAIIVGFLPITWAVWRERSIFVSVAAHMTINAATVLLIAAAFTA